MKLKPDTVILINFLFRIFLIVYLLKGHDQEKLRPLKPLKYMMNPISKRVFLIFLNGLPHDFLQQNSTPYLKEMLDNYGSFGVAMGGHLETTYQGFGTVLSGWYLRPFPFSLMGGCQESILDYVEFKCGLGRIPSGISLPLYFPEDKPLQNFQKLQDLFTSENYKNILYIISLDLDPIWVDNYKTRLRKIDDDIRFFTTVVDSIFTDNSSTYIVTAARASPVGRTLSTDVPVVAWGQGIASTDGINYMWQSDLTALLCALLGINFPSKLFGIIPTDMMELSPYYDFELTYYTIAHLEKTVEVVDAKNYLMEASALEVDQIHTRLDQMVYQIRKNRVRKMFFSSCWLVVFLTIMGVNVILFASNGFVYFFCHIKSLFFILLILGSTLNYIPEEPEFPILVELMFFWICHNSGLVRETVVKNGIVIVRAVFLVFLLVTLVGLVGNTISIPIFFAPVVLWPFFNGSYKRLNRFVLFTRLFSGIIIGALTHTRVFGERPDRFLISSASLLFLFDFFVVFYTFKKEIDAYVKINFLIVFATTFCLFPLPLHQFSWIQSILPCFLLFLSFLSLSAVSGTLLSRLLKVYLSLLVPVLMLSVRTECIFYLSVVFHVFTWIFIEYHSTYTTEFKFHPAIFSIDPKKAPKSVQFLSEDCRHVIFFMIYCYVSYFAIGNFPDLHSYDLYVLPKFVYPYPKLVGYFLGGLRFFLPFFVVTASYMTLCALKDKNTSSMIMASVWLSDVVGCFIIFYSQFLNLFLQQVVLPVKFSYFFIQQIATVSVILSYFIGKWLLLNSGKRWQKLFSRLKHVYGNY